MTQCNVSVSTSSALGLRSLQLFPLIQISTGICMNKFARRPIINSGKGAVKGIFRPLKKFLTDCKRLRRGSGQDCS